VRDNQYITDLGKGNFIFVGSSCDMWADRVQKDWIAYTLHHCILADQRENTFLFQTKNPEGMMGWVFPMGTVLGTTIETNRVYPKIMGNTPVPRSRAINMQNISENFTTMVTIEPIMDFDLEVLVYLIKHCHPKWVNIGADSQGHNLPEPSGEKIDALIAELKAFTEVKIKKNLKRLYKGADKSKECGCDAYFQLFGVHRPGCPVDK